MALSNSGTMRPRCANPSSPPGILAAGIVRVLLGQVGKVGAALNLLEKRFSLGLGGSIGLGVSSLSDLEENVARAGLFRHGVFGLVRGVVLLNLLLRGLLYAARHVVGRECEVGDAALFGIGHGIARGVLLEKRFEVGIGGIDLLAQVVGGEDGVVKFDLEIVLPVEVAHFLVADRNASGDE